MTKNHCKLSNMAGENVTIYLSQMAKTHLKLSIMVGENFEIYLSQISQNHRKLSTTYIHECMQWEKTQF